MAQLRNDAAMLIGFLGANRPVGIAPLLAQHITRDAVVMLDRYGCQPDATDVALLGFTYVIAEMIPAAVEAGSPAVAVLLLGHSRMWIKP